MESRIIQKALKGEFVLIAEIGVNFYDIAQRQGLLLMDAAKRMIDEAKAAGIHAVKFQSYKASTLAAKDSPSYWDIREESTRSQYELFCKFDAFGQKEYSLLSEYCHQVDIEFLSTAFDFESADYLDALMGVYKISSSDLSNLPFIQYQAKKGKPILLSTGASNAEEIDAAVAVIRTYNDKPLALLHCVLEYPTPYKHANLNKIASLKKRYGDLIIGYSDHTKPDPHYDVIKTAYILGAQIIEKHFTLDKMLPGNDHYHAMDSDDARGILTGIGHVDALRGSGRLACLPSEQKARTNARRSIVAVGDIAKGDLFTSQNLTFKRPGTGIAPVEVSNIIGKRAKTDIGDDTILSYDMVQTD